MSRAPGSRRTWRGIARASTASAVLLFLIVPVASGSVLERPAAGVSVVNCSNASVTAGVSAVVTWNGVNVCGHTDPSTALSVDFSQTAHVQFQWNSSTSSPLSLSDARLAMFYFGFALVTRDVGPVSTIVAASGTFDMDWAPGALTYLFEGLYGLTATLFAPNGSAVWSEAFFVRSEAPYSIVAALPILLLIIAAVELYSVARSGRQAAIGRGNRPNPPPPPPSAPVSGPTAPPPSGGADEGAPSAGSEAPP